MVLRLSVSQHSAPRAHTPEGTAGGLVAGAIALGLLVVVAVVAATLPLAVGSRQTRRKRGRRRRRGHGSPVLPDRPAARVRRLRLRGRIGEGRPVAAGDVDAEIDGCCCCSVIVGRGRCVVIQVLVA